MKVYAVSEDDVVYFDSIVECRNWIKSKGFRNENPPEVWNVYRVGEYDSDGDAYALESYDIRDYASYIVDGGRYRKYGRCQTDRPQGSRFQRVKGAHLRDQGLLQPSTQRSGDCRTEKEQIENRTKRQH